MRICTHRLEKLLLTWRIRIVVLTAYFRSLLEKTRSWFYYFWKINFKLALPSDNSHQEFRIYIWVKKCRLFLEKYGSFIWFDYVVSMILTCQMVSNFLKHPVLWLSKLNLSSIEIFGLPRPSKFIKFIWSYVLSSCSGGCYIWTEPSP